MKNNIILYIDASRGLSGDMALSAMIDLGFPSEELFRIVKELNLPEDAIKLSRIRRGLFEGINLNYRTKIRFRTLKEIEEFIKASKLKKGIKVKSWSIIKELFEAEAFVHREEVGMVSLHEMSNIDLIIEVCGVLEAIEYFKPAAIYCSAINIGTGIVESEHGKLPVPAPVTLNLIRGIPVFHNGTSFELLTPTGALIAKNIVDYFAKLPPVNIVGVGYGAGSFDLPDFDNVLRIFKCLLLEGYDQTITIIETNVDNCSGEIFAASIEKLIKAKALDVFFVPIYMKKNRPAYKLSVLCNNDDTRKIIEIIFREIPTLGIRYWQCNREVLDRKIAKVKTEFGVVKVKESYFKGEKLNVSPEYEDCKKIAKQKGIPLTEVYKKIMQGYNPGK